MFITLPALRVAAFACLHHTGGVIHTHLVAASLGEFHHCILAHGVVFTSAASVVPMPEAETLMTENVRCAEAMELAS